MRTGSSKSVPRTFENSSNHWPITQVQTPPASALMLEFMCPNPAFCGKFACQQRASGGQHVQLLVLGVRLGRFPAKRNNPFPLNPRGHLLRGKDHQDEVHDDVPILALSISRRHEDGLEGSWAAIATSV
jgi:hypothetical protein